jgi:hypothetical protein
MSSLTAVLLILTLFVKHFIVVGVLQTAAHIINKRRYFHIDSLVVSFYHFIGSVVAVSTVVGFSSIVVEVSAVECTVRHHIDWLHARSLHYVSSGKHAIAQWWVMGLDQWMHVTLYASVVWFYSTVI